MKAFVIDVARCNSCYSCQIVYKDEHIANDWSPYAKPQPDTASSEKFTATTDGFGDFWFNDLKESTFSLKIESDGKAKTIDAISTEKDANWETHHYLSGYRI